MEKAVKIITVIAIMTLFGCNKPTTDIKKHIIITKEDPSLENFVKSISLYNKADEDVKIEVTNQTDIYTYQRELTRIKTDLFSIAIEEKDKRFMSILEEQGLADYESLLTQEMLNKESRQRHHSTELFTTSVTKELMGQERFYEAIEYLSSYSVKNNGEMASQIRGLYRLFGCKFEFRIWAHYDSKYNKYPFGMKTEALPMQELTSKQRDMLKEKRNDLAKGIKPIITKACAIQYSNPNL